jgi:ribonuclease P protein component
LRAAVREVIPLHAAPGHDYVVIARAATLERPYDALKNDLAVALKRLDVWRER